MIILIRSLAGLTRPLCLFGCSHAGADNIVKEIEATFPGKRIYAMLGDRVQQMRCGMVIF